MICDHVRIGNDGLRCNHCGEHQRLAYPIDLEMVIACSKIFERKHRDCPPPRLKNSSRVSL